MVTVGSGSAGILQQLAAEDVDLHVYAFFEIGLFQCDQVVHPALTGQ